MNSAEATRNVGWFALPLLALAAHSQAMNIVDPSVSSSATINNSAVRLDGIVFAQELPNQRITKPWITEVLARRGECLRLDVTRPLASDDEDDEDLDLELVVISPDGIVYRNDDRDELRPDDLRPLVKIANTPSTGWYTVRVAHYLGAGDQTNFTLLYARYTTGNANCADPTPPLVSREAAAMGLSGEEEQATKKGQQRSAVPSAELHDAPENAEEPEIRDQ